MLITSHLAVAHLRLETPEGLLKDVKFDAEFYGNGASPLRLSRQYP